METNHLNPHSKRSLPTRLGLVLLHLAGLFPYRVQIRLGRLIGHCFFYFSRRRRHIARTNIKLCFPGLQPNERKRILREHFASIGTALIESARCWWGSDELLLGLASISGAHHLESALRDGHGVILLSGHMSAMELAAHIMGLKFNIAAMYRPMKNQIMEELVKDARSRHMSAVFPRDDTRTMFRTLREGKAVWYGFDQNYGLRHGVFAPFFGVQAATITTTSRYARATGAVVIPFFPYRDDKGYCHIEIHPPLENFPSPDPVADTYRLNQLLEQAITKAPEQYLWIHRRFKTRPEGEPPLY